MSTPTFAKTLLHNLWREEAGQDMVEYSLLLGLVVLSALAFLSSMGVSLSTTWQTINNALSSANGS